MNMSFPPRGSRRAGRKAKPPPRAKPSRKTVAGKARMDPAPQPYRRQRLVDGPRLLAGIVVAALAAGPVFCIAGTLLSTVIASPGEVFRWTEGQALPFLLLLSIRYVFLSALLPATLGAAAMAVLGAM